MKSFLKKTISVFSLVMLLTCSAQALAISGTKPPPNTIIIIFGIEVPTWISDFLR